MTGVNVEVLYDDRNINAGKKFANADHTGLPFRVVLSEKTTLQKKVELIIRSSNEATFMNLPELMERFKEKANV